MPQSRILLSVVTGIVLALESGGCMNSETPTGKGANPTPGMTTVGPSPASAGGTAQGSSAHPMRLLAGEAAGPGGGWLIAASRQHLQSHDVSLAAKANDTAEQHPAAPVDVAKSDDADLNHDGFVTLDEILAMSRAKLSDDQLVQRIRKTDQVFDMTERQKQYLRDRRISPRVLSEMDILCAKGN